MGPTFTIRACHAMPYPNNTRKNIIVTIIVPKIGDFHDFLYLIILYHSLKYNLIEYKTYS